jgi:iron complex transport system substrate-binding protein
VDARPVIAGRRAGALTRPLFALLLTVALVACGGGAATTPTPSPSPSAQAVVTPAPAATPTPTPAPTATPLFPVTLQDDEQGSATVRQEPRTIVSLTPAATETLFALGVGDRVKGKVEDFTPYPPDAAKIPDVAKYGSVDVEKIVSLQPDLVIAGGDNFNPPEAIAQLRQLGVPVLVVFAPDLPATLADIGLIGRAVGRVDEAATITGEIQQAFDDVKAATGSETKPRVYYELDASNGLYGPAPDYFGTGMIQLAGGDPLTTGQDGVYQLQPEQILAFDPQVILLGDAAYGVTPDQVKARPGWKDVTAVKDGAIRPIDDVIVTRPGPRLDDGIRALALAIHPDLVLPSAPPASAAP